MSEYNAQFAKTLKTLNKEQLQAVQHIEGPVLVVAGPGTGKTHILSARIGQILTATDTAPYNILCLTFTDAGVRAMRERLLQIIGPAAHKIHIFTFHSFCNKIIQDHLDLFGRQDLALLDDLERQEMLRRIIDELPHEHLLKKGRGADVYFYEKHLASLFRIMKTEAWSVEYTLLKIEEYIASLPFRSENSYQTTRKGQWQKGDLKTEIIEEETAKMERLASAVALYDVFEKILRGAHRYDFDDMILWVIDAFEKFSFLLRSYQEQYLYFLVDEYQDTNGSQNKVLSKLIEYWDNPNIFIVGDDDQAIYEFQGARLKSLVEFYETYQKNLLTLVLKENYRSTQNILDTSKKVIDLNNLRIINELHNVKIDKHLKAKGKTAKLQVVPTILEYPNRFHETTDIIQKIEQLQAQKQPLNSVALIYARHREAETFIALLEKKGIPYQTKRRVNVLDTPLIQNLRLILEYVLLESRMPYSGEHILFKLLYINFLNINENDVLKLVSHVFKQNQRKNESDEAYTYLMWRDVLFNLPKLNFAEEKGIQNVSQFFENAISNLPNHSLLSFIERVINHSGLMVWIKDRPDKVWQLQILNTFFEFIKSETDKKPRFDLKGLLNTLDILDKNKISVELVQNVSNTEGVVLTTAHAAKGLEFDHVFLIDAINSEWEESKSSKSGRFKLPDTLTYTTEADFTEARRRLFYVSLTRAKAHLHISYAQADERGKALSRSQFVDETGLPIEKAVLDHDFLVENQVEYLSNESKINIQLIGKEFITEILHDFRLSVSALYAYLECPLSFYFEYILKVPTVMSESARFGDAMHYALRKLFGEMLRSKDKMFPPQTDFIRYFEIDLQRQKGYFSDKEYQRRLEMGRASLAALYNQFTPTWSKNVVIEKSFTAESDGVPLKGVLDKIEFKDDGTAHITDYKSGKPTEDRLRRPTKANPNGGAYWRQLVFYKILYENYRSHLVAVKSGDITYLEPDAKGVFKSKVVDFESKDVEILRGLLTTTWTKIQNQEFEGCGKKECTWCQFIKNNQAPDSFRNEVVESFDD
jgi:DNA helicase II / ATP-dependent DNA helicase PcrA